MRRVEIVALGKLRDAHLRGICDDYYRRCAGVFRVGEREARNQAQLEAFVPERSWAIVLDERGEQWRSRPFATRLTQWLARDHASLVFVIGGADGVGDKLRARANTLLSLGKMTFAHQLVRVLLAEQLYRATSIMQGSPYHRE